MKVKKTLLVLLAGLFVAAASFTCAGIICAGNNFGAPKEEPGAKASVPAGSFGDGLTKSCNEFTVKAYNGSIGVFCSGSELPLYVTEIKTSALREADRKMLEKGVGLSSYEEVIKLLEDFSA